jgi:hypothetical protein
MLASKSLNSEVNSLAKVNNGNVEPRIYLSKIFAAMADAAVRAAYVSMRYRQELIY